MARCCFVSDALLANNGRRYTANRIIWIDGFAQDRHKNGWKNKICREYTIIPSQIGTKPNAMMQHAFV